MKEGNTFWGQWLVSKSDLYVKLVVYNNDTYTYTHVDYIPKQYNFFKTWLNVKIYMPEKYLKITLCLFWFVVDFDTTDMICACIIVVE